MEFLRVLKNTLVRHLGPGLVLGEELDLMILKFRFLGFSLGFD